MWKTARLYEQKKDFAEALDERIPQIANKLWTKVITGYT